MNFNKHLDLTGKHAFLNPSSPYKFEYSRDKLETVRSNLKAAEEGTELHALACELIKRGIKLQKSKKTFNSYVNDAIGYRMTPEQVLYFSDNIFGTADAISFKKNCLRIHDLKTGVTPAHMEQLEIYAALFCLEYNIRPSDISIELRLYQNDDIIVHKPTSEIIVPWMDKIITKDKWLDEIIAMEG